MAQLRFPLHGTAAFYCIVFGQLISLIGSGLTSFGLSAWVFRETGSPLAYSVVLVFILLPIALGSFVAGPLVDRWDRRRILILTDTTSALITLVLALLHTTGQLAIWHVYIALFVSGIAAAFQIPAQQSIIPLLVDRSRLGRAAGLSQLPSTVSEIIAPLLAGGLLLTIGLGGIFLIDMTTFVIGIISVFIVQIPPLSPHDIQAAAPSLRQEFTAGFRYLWTVRPFLYLTAFITLTIFTLGAMYALYPPLILTLTDEGTLGTINALTGIGSLVGSMLLTLLPIQRRIRAILIAALVMGAAGFAVGLNTHVLWIAVGLVIYFGALPVVIGLNRTLYQLKAPAHLLGRIFAFRLAVGTFAQTLGALLAGLLAERLGATGDVEQGIGAAIVFFAAVFGVGTVIAAATPMLHSLERKLPDLGGSS
jgi:MFS family permease